MINNTALVCFVIWMSIPWISGPMDYVSGYTAYVDTRYNESVQAISALINFIVWAMIALFIHSKISPK